MKLQITEHDITKMVNMAVKKIIAERFGPDPDPKCHINTTILYNPLTKKTAFFNERFISWNLDNKERWTALKQDMLRYADELGDGPIFRIWLTATSIGVSDDTTSTDRDDWERYSYYPEEVDIEDTECQFELKNGEISNDGDYEDVDLSEDDMEFIRQEANDNLGSLTCNQ